MRAITLKEYGGADVLRWSDVPAPEVREGEVVVDVAATAVNRADVMQRQGHYPPPPGASSYLGLECSGVIAELGPGVTGWSVGDRVCALLAGGGYAEQVAVPAGQLMPVPEGLSLVEAAALPEVAATVWSNVFMLARLQPGEVFLVHGGSSGIGTMAIQLAARHGAVVACTAGSAAKLDACHELGASILVNYHDADFVQLVRDATDGHGADVILDNMGAKYLRRNVDLLAVGGRQVTIGLQGGRVGELDLGMLLTKRAAVHATSLRARPAQEKAEICREVVEHVWPAIAAGDVRPVIDRVMPLQEAADAHRALEESGHIGKIVLSNSGENA